MKYSTIANVILSVLFCAALYTSLHLYGELLPDHERDLSYYINSSQLLQIWLEVFVLAPYLLILSLFSSLGFNFLATICIFALFFSFYSLKLLSKYGISALPRSLLIFCSYYPLCAIALDSPKFLFSVVILLVALDLLPVGSADSFQINRGRLIVPFLFAICSAIHFQSLFLLAFGYLNHFPKLAYSVLSSVRKSSLKKSSIVIILLLIVFLLVGFVAWQAKISFYLAYNPGIEISQVLGSLVFVLGAAVLTKKDSRYIAVSYLFLLLIVGIALGWLGRLNLIFFLLFVYSLALAPRISARSKTLFFCMLSFFLFLFKQVPFYILLSRGCNPFAGC